MENLFNNPIMIKIQEFGQNLGKNKFLAALQGTMMSVMGIIMVSAISQVLTSVGPMLHLFEKTDAIYGIIGLPYTYGMNLISLWICVIFAYRYAQNLKMKSPVMEAVGATICFLIAIGAAFSTEDGISGLGVSYLGSQGMFTAFITVFVVLNIDKFCLDKNIRVRMPSVCPQSLVDGFSAVIPLLINNILFIAITTAISAASGGTLNMASGIMKLLAAPLGALVSTPGMFVLTLLACVLWCFGIHGTIVIGPIITAMLMQSFTDNAALLEAGQPMVYSSVVLWYAMYCCGGTGNTMPLTLMGLRSKSKQISSVCKAAVIPAWFGINEPMIFGMPIMYNPILCIPFILNVPIVLLCFHIAYSTGFISPLFIYVSASLPMGGRQFLWSLNWKNALMDYLVIIPAGLVYYPFFKVYEKQLIEQERQQLEAAD